MAATLNVQFIDPPTADLATPGTVLSAVRLAFSQWLRHFDYTAGVYTINVSFRAAIQPADAFLNVQDLTTVGRTPRYTVVAPSFGLSLAARAAAPAIFPAPTLYVNSASVSSTGFIASTVAAIERELGHALGIQSLIRNVLTGPVNQFDATLYDRGVQFVQLAPNAVTTFNGPNAQAAFGGPVPVLNTDPGTTTAGGGVAVDTAVQGAVTIQPLDVALLRDAGLPALSDQELQEHQIARLYFGAFGRTADSAGLILQLNALRASSGDLASVGAGLASSAEFAARYGTLSDADFVRTVYQNALGRQPDAAQVASYLTPTLAGVRRFIPTRGSILAAITDSDEARGRLSANANVTYAATAEAQVARLYDAAFGRDADPAGFNTFVPAIINNTSLQQVALSFLNSAEFASRYGAAAPDAALVDALYANALHRPADAAGEALYVQALGSGRLSRAALLVAFSESQEHVSLVAQRAGTRDAAGFNLDLSPHLGIIPVISGPVAA